MRFVILNLALFVFFTNSILADESMSEVRVVQKFSTSVSGWLKAGTLIAMDHKTIKTETPIPYRTPDLVATDPSGDVILVRTLEPDHITYAVYQSNGSALGDFEQPWDPDLPLPAVVLQNQGSKIYMLDIIGRLECRRFDGTLLWKKELSESSVFSYENTYFMHFNSGQEKLLVAYSQPGSETQPGFKTQVFRLNLNGEKEQYYEINNAKILNFDRTETDLAGLMIKSTLMNNGPVKIETFILDTDLNFMSSFPVSFRTLCMADENILLINGKNTVHGVSPADGKSLWKFELKDPGHLISFSLYDKETDRIYIVSGNPEYEQGKLFFSHSSLITLTKEKELVSELDMKNYHLYPDAVMFGDDGFLQMGFKQQLIKIETK